MTGNEFFIGGIALLSMAGLLGVLLRLKRLQKEAEEKAKTKK